MKYQGRASKYLKTRRCDAVINVSWFYKWMRDHERWWWLPNKNSGPVLSPWSIMTHSSVDALGIMDCFPCRSGQTKQNAGEVIKKTVRIMIYEVLHDLRYSVHFIGKTLRPSMKGAHVAPRHGARRSTSHKWQRLPDTWLWIINGELWHRLDVVRDVCMLV
jgi:hypothetical protein